MHTKQSQCCSENTGRRLGMSTNLRSDLLEVGIDLEAELNMWPESSSVDRFGKKKSATISDTHFFY